MSDHPVQTFNFLGLPKEVRFMVYEQIGVYTQHRKIYAAPVVHDGKVVQACATLVVKGLTVQLLATCSIIHDEAKGFIIPKLVSLKKEPPRIMLESGACSVLGFLIEDCVRRMQEVQQQGVKAAFGEEYGIRTTNTAEPGDPHTRLDDEAGKRMFIRKTGVTWTWQAKNKTLLEPLIPDRSRVKELAGLFVLGIRLYASHWHAPLYRPNTKWRAGETRIRPLRHLHEIMRGLLRGQTAICRLDRSKSEAPFDKCLVTWIIPKVEMSPIREGLSHLNLWDNFQMIRGWDEEEGDKEVSN